MPKNKVEFVFDPFEATGESVPEGSSKREVLDEISDYVKERILDSVASQKSPVKGYDWPKLSKSYKKFKEESGHPGVSDLQFSGDLLDALQVKKTRGNKIKVVIEGSQAPKADGHNNHSGESTLPLRRFIPSEDDGDEFKGDIIDGIAQIIRTM
jgi:hypothetical protein